MHLLAKRRPRSSAAWMIGLLAVVGLACGDGGVDVWPVRAGLEPGAEGRTLWLVRRSSHCGAAGSAVLEAKVTAGAEFPAEQVRELGSPCLGSPSPGVDVHVEGDRVIFDFSSVERPEAFPQGSFDGYSLYFDRACPDMALEAALIDRERSTMVIGEDAVGTHFDRLDVSFAGARYDSGALLTIELFSVEIGCMGER